jgi:hypothetical protein
MFAADGSRQWSCSYCDKAVALLLVDDVSVEQRSAAPWSTFEGAIVDSPVYRDCGA